MVTSSRQVVFVSILCLFLATSTAQPQDTGSAEEPGGSEEFTFPDTAELQDRVYDYEPFDQWTKRSTAADPSYRPLYSNYIRMFNVVGHWKKTQNQQRRLQQRRNNLVNTDNTYSNGKVPTAHRIGPSNLSAFMLRPLKLNAKPWSATRYHGYYPLQSEDLLLGNRDNNKRTLFTSSDWTPVGRNEPSSNANTANQLSGGPHMYAFTSSHWGPLGKRSDWTEHILERQTRDPRHQPRGFWMPYRTSSNRRLGKLVLKTNDESKIAKTPQARKQTEEIPVKNEPQGNHGIFTSSHWGPMGKREDTHDEEVEYDTYPLVVIDPSVSTAERGE